jgi:hypothetical protein
MCISVVYHHSIKYNCLLIRRMKQYLFASKGNKRHKKNANIITSCAGFKVCCITIANPFALVFHEVPSLILIERHRKLVPSS